MYKLLLFNLLFCISLSTFSQERLTNLANTVGDGSSTPYSYVKYNDMLIFTAFTYSEGHELWKTDGTKEGTTLIKDIYPGATSSIKSQKTVILNNFIYFFADNGSLGTQLWKSDGTEAGTVSVTDFLDGEINRITVVGNQLFFLIHRTYNNWEIWKSDGTAAGTLPVKKNIVASNRPDGFISAGGLFYVTLQTESPNTVSVWRSDGTESGTFPVISNIDGNGTGDGGTSALTQFVEYNNELYFVARSSAIFQSTSSVGIMKTNGTIAGTVPVKAVHDGNTNLLEYADVIKWNNKLYFSFFDADANHYFIWESDGTANGTKKIYEVVNPTYFIPSNLSFTETDLMFSGPGSNGGSSLIKFNPVSKLAVELKSISPPTQKPTFFRANVYSNLTTITKGNNLYLINAVIGGASSLSTSKTAYISNGTAEGTLLLSNVNHRNIFFPDAINYQYAIYFNENFYFPSYGQTSDVELWRSDGTEPGSYLVKNINTGNTISNRFFFSSNNKLLFAALDSLSGNELWQSDGTKQGTNILKDIYPDKRGSFPFYDQTYADIENLFLFSANDPVNGTELWRTDGTPEGTFIVKDINQGISSSRPRFFSKVNNTVYFIAASENGENILWKTNGTSEGTIKLKSFGKNTYNINYRVLKMIAVKGTLFFQVMGEGIDLWKSDGTEAGTFKIKDFEDIGDFVPVGNLAYFTVGGAFGQYELWKSDGTEQGTLLVKNQLGNRLFPPKMLSEINNKLLFANKQGTEGFELWISDGTADGTFLLKDIAQGPISSLSVNTWFIRKNNLVYFQANDIEHGTELWKTDGTSENTILVKDISPGPLGSYPNNLALVNDTIYFAAYTPAHGMELWKSDGTSQGTILKADVLPGPAHSNPTNIVGAGNYIFFVADSELNGSYLWSLSYRQNQQITFDAVPTKTYLDPPFELKALASSGLPISFSIVSGPATLSGNTLTTTGAGQVKVKASQAGDGSYYPISVEQTFTVNKAAQVITFAAIEDIILGETSIELIASASSGLPVSYQVVSGPASVVNNVLTINAPGQIKVQASQQGNENYTPAPSIERSFTVSAILGIEDELSQKVILFPNPTADFLNISLPKELQHCFMQIVDSKGGEVSSQSVNGQENIRLYVEGLSKGLYFLLIYNSEFKVSRKFSIN